jgi:23S rRNA pseudouridine2605 synthase
MRENEKFGKKPVRRSTSEEKEAAKVYKPRTAKQLGAEPKKRSESSESDSDFRPTERKPKTSSREYRDRDDRKEERRTPRREPKREGFGGGRDGRKQEESKTYKPRTLKTKSVDKDTSKKERFADSYEADFERKETRKKSFGSDPERKVNRTKTKSFESDPERNETRKKSYYEEKYAKPERARPPRQERDNRAKDDKGKNSRSTADKFSKPKFDKREEFGTDSIKKTPKKFLTPPEIENELITDKDGLIRLNKYIANSGLCSRREADEFIAKGQITVNGVEVRELGVKVKLTDEVRFKDKALDPEKKVYILLNKPKDYVTTVEDPNATRTVMDLIQGACDQRVYPVGRLDRNSTGLLLFTNDGELTKQLTHPSFMKKKIYEVGLDKNVSPEDIELIRTGIDIEGEMIAADAIEYADDYDKSVIGIEIHSGQNRIVRRIFEKLGYRVAKLDRVYFAGLTKKNLPRGKWRFLSAKEVNMLKMNRFK